MVFLTTGTHEPFDRLVKAIDDWAGSRSDVEVFGQIAVRAGSYTPRNFPWVERLSATKYRQQVEKTYMMVAHAGMGSIIAALTVHRPILVLPRRGYLNETRNDHQFATAQKFMAKTGVYVAMNETELLEQLDEAWHRRYALAVTEEIPRFADDQLIKALQGLVHSGRATGSGQLLPGAKETDTCDRPGEMQMAVRIERSRVRSG